MATTYDKASLVMIPSGYKDDKLYSIKPTDGSGDFTFSRDGAGASPATRVNASGLIEKGRTNEILQSNQFDTTWVNSNTTETGGQSGYDGSSDAWQLTAASTGSSRIIGQNNTTTGVSTFSVYAKAGNINYLALENGTDFAYISLIDGSLGISGGTNYITYSSTDVGGGWWRVSITFNKVASSDLRIYLASSGTSTAVNSGDYIYIQDAQLESGLVATSVIETTTTAVSAGLLGDMPRLDYSGGATCPSLLLEPSRVNVLPHSEYYNASQWTKTRCTISDNTDETLSPEGVYNASKMVSTDASESYVQDEGTISGTKANLSFFAKKGDTNFVHGLVWDNSANGCRQWFNVNTGAVGGTTTFGSGYSVVSGSEKIEDFGNGWYRCSFTANVTTGVNAFRANLSSADTTITSPVNAYGYFYGVQAESASYPTSYIPTYGSASTRAKDAPSLTSVSDLIGQEEGTFFIEWDNIGDNSRPYLALSAGGSTANRVLFYESGGVNAQIKSGGSVVFQSTTASVSGTIKAAVAYKTNDFVFYVNGTQYGTDSSGATFSGTTLSEVEFDHANLVGASMKQCVVFKTRLTNAELAALTA